MPKPSAAVCWAFGKTKKNHEEMTQKQLDKLVAEVADRLSATSLDPARQLTEKQIQRVAETIADSKPADPWWVVALKVLAYLIGLLLAGVGTAEAATMVMHF